MVTLDRLNFNTLAELPKCWIKTFVGDARNLNLIEDESIDLIATHPPYVSIIPYTKNRIDGDLSNIRNVDEFIREMKKVAYECFRVLKPENIVES
jgi:DNA modification methylase